ncbi:MAG: SAF domain-containing protein [Anaerolineaceae bacterium]|nr:SAF domain-containing protein [Anaerolineaceae bacterium]
MAAGRRRSGRVFFLLAVILILIIVVVAYFMRDQIIALVSPQPDDEVAVLPVMEPTPVMYDIVVVVQPIKRGVAITEGMLGTVSYPQEDMVEGLFYTDMGDVLGKRVKYDLDPGIPLTPSLLSEGDVGSLISFEIPPNMVGISIPLSSARYAVSYALRPGDHVDIIGTVKIVDLDQDFQTKLPNQVATIFKNVMTDAGEGGISILPIDYTLRVQGTSLLGRIYQDPSIPDEFFYVIPREEQRPRYVSQTLVQNAIVLGVGEFDLIEEEEAAAAAEETSVVAAAPEGEEAAAAPPPPQPPQVITVAVPLQDAISLNFLILTEADINFVLRATGDEQIIDTQAVTLQFVMDQYDIPYPSKLPYGLEMRQPPVSLPIETSTTAE